MNVGLKPNITITNLVKRNYRLDKEKEHFLTILFEKKPIGRPEDSYIKIDIDALELKYNPMAV